MIDIHVLLLAQVLVRVVSVCIHACVRVNMCMCVMVVDVHFCTIHYSWIHKNITSVG